MMEIIQNIIKYILDFIIKRGNSSSIIIPPENKKELYNENYYNKSAWDDAKNFLLKNRKAYLAGYIVWGKANEEGPHNNVLITEDSGKKLKVLRVWNSNGLYEYYNEVILSEKDYIEWKSKGSFQTYCNIFVSVFSDFFANFRICNFIGNEYDADDCFTALKNGIYKIEKYEFVNVSLNEALEYAKNGGLSIVSWYGKPSGKWGHIAVLTGNGSSLNPGGVEIFQAGKYFGVMSFSQEFCVGKWTSSKYYILKKRVS